MTVIHVPIDRIAPNPFQTRRDYDGVPYLADEIYRIGLLQTPRGRFVTVDGRPVERTVTDRHLRQIGKGDFLDAGIMVQLAYGHRRWHAHRHLVERGNGPFGRMPVDVVELSDAAMLDCLWSENRERADLNPIEQAELLFAKWQQLGSHQAVAEEWGLSRPTISNKLRLLALPDDVKEAVRVGRLSERQAIALLPAINGDGGQELLNAIMDAPTPPASDVIRSRKRYAPRARPVSVKIGSVPMLVHGKAAGWPDDDILRRIALGAREACQRCIEVVGPPNPLVCRECPGVTLIRSLSRSYEPTALQRNNGLMAQLAEKQAEHVQTD